MAQKKKTDIDDERAKLAEAAEQLKKAAEILGNMQSSSEESAIAPSKVLRNHRRQKSLRQRKRPLKRPTVRIPENPPQRNLRQRKLPPKKRSRRNLHRPQTSRRRCKNLRKNPQRKSRLPKRQATQINRLRKRNPLPKNLRQRKLPPKRPSLSLPRP